jgi:hypothetical protein
MNAAKVRPSTFVVRAPGFTAGGFFISYGEARLLFVGLMRKIALALSSLCFFASLSLLRSKSGGAIPDRLQFENPLTLRSRFFRCAIVFPASLISVPVRVLMC